MDFSDFLYTRRSETIYATKICMPVAVIFQYNRQGAVMKQIIHKARYLLADPYTVIQNGCVRILEDGRIADVAPWNHFSEDSSATVADWGTAIILPGFVNTHVHLELTALGNRLNRYADFTDWLSQLINRRRSWNSEEVNSSFRQGIALSLSSGTTAVGDISSIGSEACVSTDDSLRKVVFKESIALSPSRADQNIAEMESVLNSTESSDRSQAGVSPHAPYTVSGKLYRRLAELASNRNIPLATHVAETEAEIEFLKNGTGEFRGFLQRMNALPPDWDPPGLTPISYLQSLGVLGPLCLLIHCNYLDRESIRLIARSGSSVVYCPRSHAFFGHSTHPVKELFDAGINVALGTDSLASNKNLSVLDEMRFLYGQRTDLKAEEILAAATANGGEALHLHTGRLEPGYWADFTVLEVPPNVKDSKIPDQILEGAGTCIGTVIGGKTAWQMDNIF